MLPWGSMSQLSGLQSKLYPVQCSSEPEASSADAFKGFQQGFLNVMSYTDTVETVVGKGVSSCKTGVNFAMWIVKF